MSVSAPASAAPRDHARAIDAQASEVGVVPQALAEKAKQNKAEKVTNADRLKAAQRAQSKGFAPPPLEIAEIDKELQTDQDLAELKRQLDVEASTFDAAVKGDSVQGAKKGSHTGVDSLATRHTVDPVGPSAQPDFFGTPNYANSPLRMPDANAEITSATGTGASLAAEVDLATGAVTAVTAAAGGSGYAVGDIVTISSTGSGTVAGRGSGATAAVAEVSESGAVTKIQVTAAGSDYTTLGIEKFVDTLPGLGEANQNDLGQYIPVGQADTTTYPGSDYYEIAVVQYQEQMHRDLPPTTLRGYVQLSTAAVPGKHLALKNLDGTGVTLPSGAQVYAVDKPHYLGPFISATKDKPVRILFRNLLPTGVAGDLHLPVDVTVMGAGMGPNMKNPTDPNAPMTEIDPQRPMCGETPKPRDCFSENRATLHLHGGITPWISDGTPHQWITPAGEDTAYPKGVSVSNVPDMPDPGPGAQTFFYTNQQSARLMFYHDHAWGITRLNVYSGEAAGYAISDPTEQALVSAGLLPADTLPLIVQDKTFVPDTKQLATTDPLWDVLRWGGLGSLWAPHVYVPAQNPGDASGVNQFGRWAYGPWFHPPTTDITHGPVANALYDPSCDPDEKWCQPQLAPGVPFVSMGMEAFNDTAMVNGTAYPTVTVDPKAYRVRLLNAANDRFFNFSLYVADQTGTEVALNQAEVAAAKTDPVVFPTPDTSKSPAGPSFIQVASEGGFLPAPTVIAPQPITWVTDPTVFNAGNVDKHALLIAPAERADTVVDFSAYAGKTLILYNDAPAAFPARDSRYDYYTDSADLTGIGGAPTTPAGFGPNTRTIMQIKVAAKTPAASYAATKLPALQAAFNHGLTAAGMKTGVFETAQPPIVVGQKDYNAAYGTSFDTGPLGSYPNERLDGLVRMTDTKFRFDTLSGNRLTDFPLQPKALHDEMGAVYDKEYGRMSGNLGLEGPNKTAAGQQIMLYPYVNPPTEILTGMVDGAPIATLDDGTQIWKITHNGVDTHPLHFHLYDIQLINRVGWDGIIRKPDANELGWKDTVRVSPLEDTVVALRPILPRIPFGVPDSHRPLDPSMPLDTMTQFNQVGPDGNQVTTPIKNVLTNFQWEYVWHCHILSHEEMDMMRPVSVAAPHQLPGAPSLTWRAHSDGAQLTWTDPTPVAASLDASWGNWSSEIGFRVYRAPLNPDGTTGTFGADPVGTALANQTSYVDPAMTTSNAVYKVVAFNAMGETASNLAQATVPPSTPAGLTVTSEPIAAGATSASTTVAWTASTPHGADTYTLERSVDPTFSQDVVQVVTGSAATTTTDSGLTPGEVYAYRVRGTSANGDSPWSETVTVRTALAAPSGVTATAASPPPTVTVSWSAVAGATAYEIARSTGAAFDATMATTLGTSPSPSFSDSTADTNTVYSYGVRALAGPPLPVQSPWSTTSVSTWPGVPTGVTAVAGSPHAAGVDVTVTWSAAPGATAYRVEASTDATFMTGVTVLASATTELTVKEVGRPFATQLHYRVAASNPAGLSAWSGTASVVTGIGAPTSASVTTSAVVPPTATLTWSAVSGATGYQIAASDGSTFEPATASIVDAPASPFTTPELPANATVTYAVRAVALVGTTTVTSDWTQAGTITTLPDVPTALAATASGAGQIALTWTAPTASVTGYVLQRSTDAAFTAPVVVATSGTTTSATDSGLAGVTIYFYRVAAVNPVGQSDWSASAEVITALSKPASATATASAFAPPSVRVTWAEVTGTSGYEVGRSDGATFDEANAVFTSATSTTLTDTSVTTNGTYTYAVRAVTLVGTTTVRSGWTGAGTVTTVLAPPSAVIAVAGAESGQVDVSWTAPAGAVTGYVVERSSDSAFTAPVVVATSGTATTAVDTGLASITRYYYRVRTLSSTGTSAWSATVDVTTGLSAPTQVTATASATAPSVTVTWDSVQGASGYEVARIDGLSWSVVGSTLVGQAGATSPFIDTSATSGTTYTYAVRAVYVVGGGWLVSGWSPAAAVTTIPAAPTSISATPGAVTATEASVDLAWFATLGATGYVVQRSADSAFTSPTQVTSIADATAHDNGLGFVTTYYYRVAATNAAGQSPWSPAATVLTNLGAPTQLTATASTVAPVSVSITWQPVSGATAYALARSTGATFDSGTATVVSSTLTTAAYADTEVSPGAQVTYAVRALYAGAEPRQSEWSSGVTVTILPGTPTGVTAVAAPPVNGQSAIVVSWTAVSGATGYTVQRAEDAAFMTNVAMVPWASGTTVTDPGVASATTYYYRVAATNAAGTSAWSLGVQAATSLDAPGTFTAVASVKYPLTVTLSWTAPAGATGYQVERSTNGFFTRTVIAPIAGTTAVDVAPAPSTAYSYRVRATAANGAVLSAWKTATVTTPATPLVQVTGVTTAVAPTGPAGIVVSWTGQPWAASYQVQTSTSPRFSSSLVTSPRISSLSTVMTDVKVNVRYFVRVRAVGANGAPGPWSTTTMIVPTLPARPASLTLVIAAVNSGTANVGLSWTPGSTAPVGGYVIQRSTRRDFGGATTVAQVSGDTLTYADPADLRRNARYYYRIAAVTSMGRSPWQTASIMTPR